MPRLPLKTFRRLVEQAMERIPGEFLRHIEEVAVLVEEEPSEEVLSELGVPEGETLFGAYFGVPVGEKGFFDVATEPDRIVIYKAPIEDQCETLEEMIEEIETTVVHEVAHHFGIDDEVLAHHGYD